MGFYLDVTGLVLVQFGTSHIDNAALKCRPSLRKPHVLFRLRKGSVKKKKLNFFITKT